MLVNSIGIITPPISKSGVIPLSNLIEICYSISTNIFLLTGDEGYNFFKKDNRLKSFRISHKYHSFFIYRIFNYILLQIKISFWILKTRGKINIYIFFIGGDTLVLPLLIARILRKKVFLSLAGSSIKTLESKNDPLRYGLTILNFINCTLANKIFVYAECLISEYSLDSWTRKIVITREHSIDLNNFKIKRKYLSREFIVGYVGRFDEEKGILNLLHAVPNVVTKKQNIRFLFIGDGSLRQTIEQYTFDNNLNSKVILPGWISHEKLPYYLNEMKLLVIPSDTEGLPNVLLEAMACGTPVLATPVGAIPDIIKEGDTGFLMGTNSPEDIEKNILRVLQYKGIDKIIDKNRYLIEQEYTLEKAVERFRNILNNM
jgi:glycosyltransferase involved in cell wall biosynthesis